MRLVIFFSTRVVCDALVSLDTWKNVDGGNRPQTNIIPMPDMTPINERFDIDHAYAARTVKHEALVGKLGRMCCKDVTPR